MEHIRYLYDEPQQHKVAEEEDYVFVSNDENHEQQQQQQQDEEDKQEEVIIEEKQEESTMETEIEPLSSLDEEAIKKIDKIRNDALAIANQLEYVPEKMERQRARICLATWRLRADRLLPNEDAESICKSYRQSTHRLYYDTGMIGENLLRKLLELDSISGNNEVRNRRRATVVEVNQFIQKSDQYKLKAQRMMKLVEKLEAVAKSKSSKVTEAASTSTKAVGHETQIENEQSQETKNNTTQPAKPKETKKKRPSSQAKSGKAKVKSTSNSNSTPNEVENEYNNPNTNNNNDISSPKKTARVLSENLPEWKPDFKEQIFVDGVKLTADLSGVREQDLNVEYDSKSRILTVAGFKLPSKNVNQKQKPNFPPKYHMMGFPFFSPYHYNDEEDMEPEDEVYGKFSKSFEIPSYLSGDEINATFTNGLLTIVIPKSKIQRASCRRDTQYPQYSQYPSYYSSPFHAASSINRFGPFSFF